MEPGVICYREARMEPLHSIFQRICTVQPEIGEAVYGSKIGWCSGGAQTGDVFGSPDRWHGLGILVDTYDNDNKVRTC